MKKLFPAFLAFVVLAFAASCAKEQPNSPDGIDSKNGTVVVKAVVNEPITKSDYEISGSTASFSWSSGDSFYRLVRAYSGDTYSNYNHYSYYADNSTINGATADFSGTAVDTGSYDDSGFALYPANKNNGANFTYKSGTSSLMFILNEELTYDSANPLKDIIPMVGKLTDGVFVFKPVTGVVAIRATGIPSSATKISITSTSGGFSGTSVTMTSVTVASYTTNINNLVGPDSDGLKNNWFTAGTAKSFIFSSLSDSETYTFYFPVPVGTYSDLTVTISNDANEVLGTVSASGLSLAVSRAKIYPISTVIDFTLANYANIAVGGTASSINAYLESASASVSYVKIAVAGTEEDALTAASTSSIQFTGTGSSYAQTVSGDLTDTGKYYLAYKGYNSSNDVIVSGTMPVYFISATDASSRAGVYKRAYSASMYPTTLSDNGDDTITFAVSDDPLKGNIMITQALGFCYDVSESTHTSLKAYDFSTFTDGSPIYGYYNPANSAPQLYFYNISSQVFYYDAGGYPHFICEYGTDTLRFAFDNSAYNSTTYDLICWGGYIMNCYTNTSSYDLYINKFAANKQ